MKRQKEAVVVLVSALMVALALGPAPRAAAHTPQPDESGVPADWWATVQEEIAKAEYSITWQEQTYLEDVPTAYQAPNRAENLRTYFGPAGPIVIPRLWPEDATEPNTGAGHWWNGIATTRRVWPWASVWMPRRSLSPALRCAWRWPGMGTW